MFKTKEVKSKTLGEYLIALRGHLGMSVAEVSKVAKIPPKYISSLEQGDYTKLPSTVYVKGFLKTLSEIYRVEQGNLLALYASEKNLSDQLTETNAAPRDRTIPKFVFSPRTLTVGVVVLLGVASLGYLYFQLSSVRRAPMLEVFSPNEDSLSDTSYLLLDGHTESGISVFLNNQQVIVDAAGKFRENLSLAPGINELVIKAVNKFGKETTITRKVVISEKKIAGVLNSATSTPAESSELTLEVQVGPSTSWVSLEVDSQDVFTGTMLPGSSRTLTGKFIRLSTTNAGSVRVIMGGQDLGVLGKENETLRGVEFSK